MIKSAKEAINFFYISLFIVTLLFLSAFSYKLYQINSNVLGVKTEYLKNNNEITKQIDFWGVFVLENPQYIEGYVELYNFTGDTKYLNKVKEIDPNR